MDKVEEFEDFLKQIEEDANKKFGIPKNECLTTSDGKEVSKQHYKCVKILLAGCTFDFLKSIESEELIDRLTENFIRTNTKADLDKFLEHHAKIKFMNLFGRMFK